MKPVKTAITEIVYRGPGEIGDLWCHRVEPGQIMSVWEPTEEEQQILANGGKVVLWLYNEPIPPVALAISNAPWTEKVAEHPYKVIAELGDEARQ
jgi:hypothetical protein